MFFGNWLLVIFIVGVGGSLLLIGFVVGVVFMGVVYGKYMFLSYLKWIFVILFGYVVSIVLYLLFNY